MTTRTECRFALSVTFLVIFCALGVRAGAGEFPVPRAEPEFRTAMDDARSRLLAVNGDLQMFVSLIQPYGLTDIEVREASNHGEINRLRGFFLGAMGAAARVRPDRLTHAFHCGEPCVLERAETITALIPQAKEAAAAFTALKNTTLIARWPGGHRFDDFFHRDGQYHQAIPSEEMGFVPSGNWRPASEVDVVEQSHDSMGALKLALNRLANSTFVAIVQEKPDSIRGVWSGIGDNQAGLWFSDGDEPPAEAGEHLRFGETIRIIVLVQDGVYYYETS